MAKTQPKVRASAEQSGLSPRRGRRPLAEGPALDRARLTSTLLALAQQEGMDALNMRRVAAELGVSPRLLYRFVADKDEMIELLGDAITERCAPAALTGSWKTRLTKLGRALLSSSTQFPNVPSWVLVRSAYKLSSPVSQRIAKETQHVLREAGLNEAQARQAFISFAVLTTGHIALGHSADASPVALGMGTDLHIGPRDLQTNFEKGLRGLIAEIEVLARSQKAKARR